MTKNQNGIWERLLDDADTLDAIRIDGEQNGVISQIARRLREAAAALSPQPPSTFDWQLLRDTLCSVSQIFNGWRPDPDWSEWDEQVAQDVIAIRREIDIPPSTQCQGELRDGGEVVCQCGHGHEAREGSVPLAASASAPSHFDVYKLMDQEWFAQHARRIPRIVWRALHYYVDTSGTPSMRANEHIAEARALLAETREGSVPSPDVEELGPGSSTKDTVDSARER